MPSPTWKRCSACGVHSTRSSFPIPPRSSPARGYAVKRRGCIDLIPWKLPELPNVSKMTSTPSAPGAATATAAVWDDLRKIAGAEHLRSAGVSDCVAGVQPQMVFEPGNENELAAALRCAETAGLCVVPRGGGTKSTWGNRPVRADLIFSTARLNRVIEHAWADLTVSVEAGCTIQNLQNTLTQHGQHIAVDPLWPERATVAGVLSTNDSGTLPIRY